MIKEYLPPNIANGKIFSSLLNSEQIEIDNININIQDILNQCFIDSATWGMDLWESFFGIQTDITKDMEYRRSVIKAKKRGKGTVTVDFIKNVAMSFSNGQVEVIEDNSNYNFIIKFTGTKGIPPNIDDLKAVIEELKTAHLGVTYEFTWITWNEHDNYNKTYDEWDALNLTWDDYEVYKEGAI